MEKKDTTTCQPEKYFSPANNIPDAHQIVQHDVIDSIVEMQNVHRYQHGSGLPMEWTGKTMEAYETIHRARRHQPGEKGSSTWSPRSTRPGTIVRS